LRLKRIFFGKNLLALSDEFISLSLGLLDPWSDCFYLCSSVF
jgi:hypothetical protein